VKGYISTCMQSLFSKEVCIWQLFSWSLMFEVKQC
jgi:hypothetical protein